MSITPTPSEQVNRQRRTTSSRESGCDIFQSKFVANLLPKLCGVESVKIQIPPRLRARKTFGSWRLRCRVRSSKPPRRMPIRHQAHSSREQVGWALLLFIRFWFCVNYLRNEVFSERAIQRVLREVRAMAKLDHPGIIRYYHTWIERPPDGWQVHIISTSNSIFFQTRSYTYAIKLNTFQSKRTEHLPDQSEVLPYLEGKSPSMVIRIISCSRKI